MTLSYLEKVTGGQLDPSGNGILTLSPDVGQFWAPSLVSVSAATNPKTTPFTNQPLVTLFRGTSGQNLYSSYIDDTYNGCGDTSSVLAGSAIQYGQSITAVFAKGTISDSVTMSVYGRSSDSLVELQSVLSPIPGNRFAGNAGSTMVWEYNNFLNAGPGDMSTAPPTWVTSPNLLCELVCVQYKVATSATVANRFYGMSATALQDATNQQLFIAFNGQAHTAGTSVTYTFAPGLNNFAMGLSGAAFTGTSLPSKLILPPSSTVIAARSNAQAGDTWTNFQVVYRQYQTLTKLGYT